MRRNETRSIGDILASLKQDVQLGRQFGLAVIWERWEEIAGKRLASHGAPRGVRDATLYVEVASAVWMHRYGLHKSKILGQIEAIAGRDLVTDLFLVLRDDDEPDATR